MEDRAYRNGKILAVAITAILWLSGNPVTQWDKENNLDRRTEINAANGNSAKLEALRYKGYVESISW